MYILMTMSIMIIALSWWFIVFTLRKNEGSKPDKEPSWVYLVTELENSSAGWKNPVQLHDYLQSVDDQVRKFETDYSFLVAYNSTIRQIRDRLPG